jgi:hypothetical protein
MPKHANGPKHENRERKPDTEIAKQVGRPIAGKLTEDEIKRRSEALANARAADVKPG